jgi:glycosyltransferase involved in cell wall biosynthesis
MRIAQVSPLKERVPPFTYGGIELVVSLLTDELVRRGHKVTLFASGDSQTLAELQSVYPRALRLDPNIQAFDAYELLELSQVYEQAKDFDIIHSHMGYMALPFANLVKTPTVHTLHFLAPDSYPLFSYYCKQSYISISQAQRDPGLKLNYVRTVYNGINPDDYPFQAQPQVPPYLAFVGRMSPEKGPHHAIKIAKQTGWPLKMAGKVDVVDRKFFEQEIAPQIDGKQIEYLGEVDHAMKAALLGNAAVTLFPITWHEPFGLVMIESMCTGTPVVGIRLGSVPEVIAHGKSGFICQSVEEIASSIPAALELNRQVCRDHVLKNFSVTQMVDGYEAVYGEVTAGASSRQSSICSPVPLN